MQKSYTLISLYLAEVHHLFIITMYTIDTVLPINDAINITPITISATNRPVLDEVEETNKIEVMDDSVKNQNSTISCLQRSEIRTLL